MKDRITTIPKNSLSFLSLQLEFSPSAILSLLSIFLVLSEFTDDDFPNGIDYRSYPKKEQANGN